MTTLSGNAALGKAGILSPFVGVVANLAGSRATGRSGILALASFTIPNVVGVSLDAARLLLNTNTFQVGALTYLVSSFPLGNIVEQSPVGGTVAVENSPVSLVISSGPPSPTNNPTTDIRLPNLPNKILPPDNQLVDNRGVIYTNWWRFLLNVSNQAMGTNQTVPSTVTAGPSPYVFTTPAQGMLLVAGGPVTLIEYSKDGETWYPTGVTQGQIQMSPNDHLRITYMNAPTLTFFPR